MKLYSFRFDLTLCCFMLAMLLMPTLAMASDGSLIGPKPYTFPARSAQSALILYENKRSGNLGQGVGATTIYSNTSISANNWQQIEMTLGDNAEAALDVESSQSSEGSQSTTNSDFLNRRAETQGEEELQNQD
ncbi:MULTISPECIES: hypothetical protein [unclassified Halomonas]|uniref:hypothetical protein n=1 Tax=unclassified Halomonas TaxID=2609666 RepID=UPI0005584E90|nr:MULTISPECIES: hypothetical protein [unclassified Halomonas]MBR9902655.1 hypothetical protein [Gammaproteobacteria bacterium]CEP36365.1 Putative uncharacterized protein [Halomonas sp. R57-5]